MRCIPPLPPLPLVTGSSLPPLTAMHLPSLPLFTRFKPWALHRCNVHHAAAILHLQPAADGPVALQRAPSVCSSPGIVYGNDWTAAATAAAAAAHAGGATAVIGPRGSGKSTFVKWAANRLLSNHKSVFIIDVDPGQTDSFLPCCLAVLRVTQPLLAPPHALDLKPFSVHFYGHTSPAVDIDAYRRAVAAAAASARAAAAAEGAPLIVNTLGWVKGVG